ncbi:ABC transporter ATP-binding protein [Skermania piniformis]|uniref:ABC transporter ATP-binding protein n=1 Tax=Skermania pinensis TaxID=39122 RepID=A0ABX8S796_9ACTN|nr:ABC transporter ATP-binding protein [Skermania piniformis]QXQ13346.1 ABC transporter ATP-binding protein [Skermania piniformis]
MDRPISERLAARRVSVDYGDRPVLAGLDVAFEAGTITTIVGPNGCGKSTLLRALGRLLAPRSGTVVLDGHDIARMRARDLARRIGILPQGPVTPAGLTVADLVGRGRYPHQSWLRQWSADDEAVVRAVLDLTGMAEFADRPIDELSGGQRQRAWISLTLAQETGVLLLDEPTTYLDLSHAVEVLDLVDRLNVDLGRTVVMVLHDLNLAIRYSDRLVVLSDGAVVASGRPEQVITAELLRSVFRLAAQVVDDPVAPGLPLVVPHGRRRAAARSSKVSVT